MMDENEIREVVDRHWATSDANDFEVEHDIHRDDAVMEYPRSGERSRMEFLDDKVVRETRYFSDPFALSLSRANLAGRMG